MPLNEWADCIPMLQSVNQATHQCGDTRGSHCPIWVAGISSEVTLWRERTCDFKSIHVHANRLVETLSISILYVQNQENARQLNKLGTNRCMDEVNQQQFEKPAHENNLNPGLITLKPNNPVHQLPATRGLFTEIELQAFGDPFKTNNRTVFARIIVIRWFYLQIERRILSIILKPTFPQDFNVAYLCRKFPREDDKIYFYVKGLMLWNSWREI